MPPEVVFYTMPPAKKTSSSSTPPLPRHEKADARWRWVKHADGSLVAERREADEARLRVQADLYGAAPLLSTGAHMRGVDSVLTEVVGGLQLQEAEVAPELLAQAWQKAVGDFLSSHSQLVGLTNGLALISTAHPAVRFELQRHTKNIIRALNSTLGEGCVHAVRLVHG